MDEELLFACDNRSDTAAKTATPETLLSMATCEVCENEYDKAFEMIVAGKHHTFDSFECAIHALAPVCPHCHCRVVGTAWSRAAKSSAASIARAAEEKRT